MLDLSTAHLTPETRTMLLQERLEGALYYSKGPWGWFVNVPSKADNIPIGDEVPHDLKACIEYAQDGQHDWIMLDNDGTVMADLPVYGDIDDEPAVVAVVDNNARNPAHSFARSLTERLESTLPGATAKPSIAHVIVGAVKATHAEPTEA